MADYSRTVSTAVIILHPEASYYPRVATIKTMAINWLIIVWSANPLIFDIM